MQMISRDYRRFARGQRAGGDRGELVGPEAEQHLG
jgi:hypothetical protein